MGTAIGATGLAISILTNGINAVEFLVTWVADSKQYGGDVRVMWTRLVTESARLSALQTFLEEKNPAGKSRFSELSVGGQRAISGMLQELEVLFDSYSNLVKKYKLEELKRSYESQMSLETEDGSVRPGFELVSEGKETSKSIQEEAIYVEVAAWGLFRKKKIEDLIQKIETWNDKLQGFLLLGVCFGSGPKMLEKTPQSTLGTLRVETGISLRKLVLDSPITAKDLFKTEWLLDKAKDQQDTRIQTLVVKTGNGAVSQTVFVEYKEFKPRRHMTEPSSTVLKEVSTLAKLLSQPKAPESGFRTLQCAGLIRQTFPTQRFAFVFRLPNIQQSKTTSFVDLATVVGPKSDEVRPSLGERFTIARALAESLYHFHSVEWLHKSIWNKNVLFFRKESSLLDYAKPYLVGFEFSRSEGDRSRTDQDDSVERNIYRHPDKQGQPEERFNVLHDIYALGTLLLEIGLWRPLIGFADFTKMQPEEVKTCLEQHARDRLPHYMGLDYTEAVLECLGGTLVDTAVAAGTDKPWGVAQRDSVQTGFWEKVIAKLEYGMYLR